jgi:hypothetical protein
MSWLQQVYREEGPITREDLRARGQAVATAVASAALSAVLRDVERATGTRGEMELAPGTGWVQIRDVATGQRSTEGFSTADPDEALVAVADAVADLLADRDPPVLMICPEHGLGLHARLESGRAVWVCIPAQHAIGAVGDLPEANA